MTTTTATLADAEARTRLRTELDTTFFVEAGAGTGKTTALVSRIVELVALRDLQMERLAAITFTEAAAAELRDRIRQDLEKAAVSRTDRQQKARCEQASHEVDLASIQTIHAFAGSLLRTYPLEAHLPPNFGMLDEIQQERGFDDRFRAWLYDDVPDEDFPERRSAVRRALTLGMSPDQLRELATRLQDYRDLIDPYTVWDRPRPRDPVEVANRWGRTLVDLAPVADEASAPTDKLALELRRLQVVAQRMAAVADGDEALRLLRQCKPNSQSNWAPGHCKALKAVLKECDDEVLETLGEHRTAALADVLQHLRDFTLAYADARRHDGEASFHDLLTWARNLLRDKPEVRLRAQARFDRVFVDEFQDTDPLQVEIVWFLTAEPAQAEERQWTKLDIVPGKLFIVGDPKQSIYRFRRADIGIYHQVYAQLEDERDCVQLCQSFRSPVPLVDWFNHHFDVDMLFVDRVQPGYTALAPRPANTLDPAIGRFGVHQIGNHVDTAAERWSEEARTVARLGHQIVEGSAPWIVVDRGATSIPRAATYKDICVLIPTRTNLRRLERAFGNEGVPYRVESGWLVLHTQEVRDLLSCLRAIDDPSDQVALVAALRSPAYACSDLDLLRWIDAGGRFDYEHPGRATQGPVWRGLRSLEAFHRLRMDRSPAATAELFVRDRMLAVQAFGSAHPRDALRRLRYVVAQARTLAASGQPTLRALCDWLESRQREQYYDAESAVPDADEDAVRFITVHGSKGLEFPIVILTGLGVATSRGGPQSVDLVPRYETGVLEVHCGEFTTSGYARDSEKTMYEAEQKRLLYVGTTRARDHLVLSLYHGKDACHASRILDRLKVRPELSTQVVLEPSVQAAATVSSATTNPMTPEQHRVEEERWLLRRQTLIEKLSDQHVLSPSSLGHEPVHPEPDPPPEPDANNRTRRIRKGRGSSAVGRAVHAVLQTIDLATLANLDVLAEAAAREENVPGRLDDIQTYVRDAAASDPVRRALARGRYWREVPVGVLRDDGAMLEGAIDLLFEHAEGTLGVVDYKTDQVKQSQADTRTEGYRAQGEAYRDAVELVTGKTVTTVEFVFAALGGSFSTLMRR
jgi:ATP-dependent helicase/nuclease subunit A